ncbi:MAG: hypothetical protein ACRDIY_15700 [Chloroflexota bacterium]
MIVVRVVVFVLGLTVVVLTCASAVRALVLPRGVPDTLSWIVFTVNRWIFGFWLRWTRSYLERDAIMAFFAPISVLALLPTWLVLVLVGYTAIFWGLGAGSWYEAFRISGSSVLTLGFDMARAPVSAILALSEAAIGLILVALLIAYLPTMYAAFSRREASVTMLEVRAGSPPSAVELIQRYHRIHGIDHLTALWETWEIWFADVEESHTSLGALTFFRSPRPGRSWVTAAGTILDAAALTASTLDRPRDARAELCIRAGYIALRGISDFFAIQYDPDPRFPARSISVDRAEFDQACELLAQAGVPLKPDRDQAWRDFAGWRVNYDQVLLALCTLTMAPWALWSSDRAPKFRSRPLFGKPKG